MVQIGGVMAEPLQGKQTWTGVLEYQFGDSPDHKIAFARYFLYVGEETRMELLFDVPPWHGYWGKQVVVEGTAEVTAQAETMPTIRVSGISLAAGGEVTSAAVTGTRNVILLLVKFRGDSQEPHTPSRYTDTIFNPSTGNTVNSFYMANSWGQLGWTATVTNWMTGMDYKTTYANCASGICADLNHLFDDAVALGVAAGVNFALYDNIAIVTNNDLDCCAAGGERTYNGKTYGVVWEPPWSAQVGTFVHELGHSIGLPHSGWVYYDYDSPWDAMSQGDQIYNRIRCGAYTSRNYNNLTWPIFCPTPADIIAPYKDLVGWIDEAHLLTVPAGGSAAGVPVDSLAAPLSSAYKMIKVCVPGYDCTGGGEQATYYTVEARTRYGFDRYLGLPDSSVGRLDPPNQGGVIIHYYDWTHSSFVGGHCFHINEPGPAYPVDNFNVVPPPHYNTERCSDTTGRYATLTGLYYADYDPGQFVSLGASTTVGVVSSSTAGGITTYLVDINTPPRYSANFRQTGIPIGITWGVTVGGTRRTTAKSDAISWPLLSAVEYQYDSSVVVSLVGSYVCTSGCSGSVSGPGTVTATYRYQPFIATRNLRPSIISLTPDVASPQKVGSTITWTCRASDPENDPIQYRFQIQVAGGSWVTVQNWSKSNVYIWTPPIAGSYNVRCQVIDGKHLSILGYDAVRTVYDYRIL
jgi:M6 family metalloprotease-like protein